MFLFCSLDAHLKVMNKILLTAVLTGMLVNAAAQKKPPPEIARVVTKSETEAHLRFLASDELRGRDTGSPELDIAAEIGRAHV